MHPPLTIHRHPMCADKNKLDWYPFNLKFVLRPQDFAYGVICGQPSYPVDKFLRDGIIEQFQKCHTDHPLGKFFGVCTDLKIKLDKCFRQEKALKRKANFEESKKLKERLRAYRMEEAQARE